MRRCCPIATIVELVTELIEPSIQAPFELVDVEYEKVVGDYVLSIFVDKPGGITLNDTADLTEVISPLLDQIQPDLYKAIDKQKVFEGTLLAFEEDELTVEYMDKTRKKTVQIPYSLVSKARLAVKF